MIPSETSSLLPSYLHEFQYTPHWIMQPTHSVVVATRIIVIVSFSFIVFICIVIPWVPLALVQYGGNDSAINQ